MGPTEHEMVGWHHWLNGHESEQTPGDSEGQGGLAWHAAVDGVRKNQTWPNDWTTTMAEHESYIIHIILDLFSLSRLKEYCRENVKLRWKLKII